MMKIGTKFKIFLFVHVIALSTIERSYASTAGSSSGAAAADVVAPIEVIRSDHGVLTTTLTVAKSHHMIGETPVHLRSYNGKLAGPTFRVRAGDLLNITLRNQLVAHPPMGPMAPMVLMTPTVLMAPTTSTVPVNINDITNLHTHGLHVSPSGNSDNILVRVLPGQHFEYEIKIPSDHPAGTFWYHAHVHGSTAVQVGSGLAGALVVEGGIDGIPEIQAASEQVFLLQQPPYDAAGEIESRDNMGPGVWGKGTWHTLINGWVQPRIKMQPGEVQRWRFINGAPRESIKLSLVGHTLSEIAVDGLTTGRIDGKETLELYPGYRSDVLVRAGAPGVYALVDRNIAGDKVTVPGREILAYVDVEGDPKPMTFPSEEHLRRFAFGAPREGTDVPVPDVRKLTGLQNVHLSIDSSGTRGLTESLPTVFQIDSRSMGPMDSPRFVPLEGVEEWKVTTNLGTHPFHIHVNPFLVTRVVNLRPRAFQNPETRLWEARIEREEDPAFRPTWRDTFAVSQDQEVYFRTRYSKYIGRFVLHCHILDHEDEGMMQLVEVVDTLPTHHGDSSSGGGHGGH